MKDFTNYNQALALRDLKFNKPCLGFYDGKGDTTLYFNNLRDASGDFELFSNNKKLTWFGAPTYSQAFRWFRERYDLRVSFPSSNPISFEYVIVTSNELFKNDEFEDYEISTSHEEAESACLDKLIEIVKDQSNEQS